jgi:hypothetical protein
MSSGNALGAVVSVLPATSAFIFAPNLLSQQIASNIVLFALLWGVSYALFLSGRKLLAK